MSAGAVVSVAIAADAAEELEEAALLISSMVLVTDASMLLSDELAGVALAPVSPVRSIKAPQAANERKATTNNN